MILKLKKKIFLLKIKLLVEMSEKEKLDRRPIYTPRKFVSTVWRSLTFWADGSQQDAHEVILKFVFLVDEK